MMEGEGLQRAHVLQYIGSCLLVASISNKLDIFLCLRGFIRY